MRSRFLLIGATLIGIPLAVGAFVLQDRDQADAAKLFAQVLQQVERSSVDSLSRSQLFERAARGLLRELKDPYADLYSPEELSKFQRNTLRNNYGGVGMQIENQEGLITIMTVFPNS